MSYFALGGSTFVSIRRLEHDYDTVEPYGQFH